MITAISIFMYAMALLPAAVVGAASENNDMATAKIFAGITTVLVTIAALLQIYAVMP